jgi:Uma2 family endonuclease
MGMPAKPMDWTADMVHALPDDGIRYEVLDGELFVSPAPTWSHQRVVGAFFRRLYAHATVHRLGDVLMAPAEVEFSARRLLEPDLFVVPLVNGRVPLDWSAVRRLLLVVEVLSPSTARTDRFRKRDVYRDQGVPEYWIVHSEARLVERWLVERSESEFVDDVLTWRPSPDTPELTIDVQALFAEALD